MPPTDRNRVPGRVCSARHASFLVAGVRRLLHNPAKILCGLISQGQTAVDLGCGPGFFTLDMAQMVGEGGRVIAVDLQQGMLDLLVKRARAAGLEERIQSHKCESDRIGLDALADFALAFYMVHEVPDQETFLCEVHRTLRPGGTLLLVEPKFHVSAAAYGKTLEAASDAGFSAVSKPRITLSRSVLLQSKT